MRLSEYKNPFFISLIILAAFGALQAGDLQSFREEIKQKTGVSEFNELEKCFLVLEKAVEEGMPSEPLENKIKEGLLKKQPPDMIEKAVERRRERMRISRYIAENAGSGGMKISDTRRMNASILESLERNVPEKVIEDIVLGPQALKNDRYAERVVSSVGDLIQAGYTPQEASELVLSAVRNGYSGKSLEVRLSELLAAEKREKADVPGKKTEEYKRIEKPGQLHIHAGKEEESRDKQEKTLMRPVKSGTDKETDEKQDQPDIKMEKYMQKQEEKAEKMKEKSIMDTERFEDKARRKSEKETEKHEKKREKHEKKK
ncbi:MAG: hypothetical protein JXJ19_05495 [Elusimicrobia bacterium]|nr:hypothetical protein [Elusimicrobiota bacterium]